MSFDHVAQSQVEKDSRAEMRVSIDRNATCVGLTSKRKEEETTREIFWQRFLRLFFGEAGG
jgi:hypothetical protein